MDGLDVELSESKEQGSSFQAEFLDLNNLVSSGLVLKTARKEQVWENANRPAGHITPGWEGVAGDLNLRVTSIWVVFSARPRREQGGSSRAKQPWKGRRSTGRQEGAAAGPGAPRGAASTALCPPTLCRNWRHTGGSFKTPQKSHKCWACHGQIAQCLPRTVDGGKREKGYHRLKDLRGTP